MTHSDDSIQPIVKTNIKASRGGIEKINRTLDKISADALEPRNAWERLCPSGIQRAARAAIVDLIRVQSQARLEAFSLVTNAQIKHLNFELQQGLATAAIEKKAESMVFLATKRQEATAKLYDQMNNQIAEYEKRIDEAEQIRDPHLRDLRLEQLAEAINRFTTVVENQISSLDTIINNYSES